MALDYTDASVADEEHWLRRYYYIRAGFSAIWVALALTVGQNDQPIAAALLFVYPLWDALANYIDASSSGGLAENKTQAINAAISLVTALAVGLALQKSMNVVLGVFGVWAIVAGLLQLATAVRRWKSYGAQWAMILSGGQSALAGGFFVAQAVMPTAPSISGIAGYAGVGAAYFLISAAWLSVSALRRRSS